MKTKSFPFFNNSNETRIVTMFFVVSFLIWGCATTPNVEVVALYEGPARSDEEIATIITTGLSSYDFRQKGIGLTTTANSSIVAVQNKENGKIRKIQPTSVAKLLPNTYRLFVDTVIEDSIDRSWRNQLSVTKKLEKGFVYAINPKIGEITRQTFFGKEIESIETISTSIEFKELGRIGDFSDQHTNQAVSLQSHDSMSGITEKELAGSRWKMEYPYQGRPGWYEIVLGDRGKLFNKHSEDKTPNDDRWEISGEEIKLGVNKSRLILTGKFYDANHMAGYAQNGTKAWIWRATKITE